MIDVAANNQGARALPLVCEECKLVSLAAAQFTTAASVPECAAYKPSTRCTFIEVLAQQSPKDTVVVNPNSRSGKFFGSSKIE